MFKLLFLFVLVGLFGAGIWRFRRAFQIGAMLLAALLAGICIWYFVGPGSDISGTYIASAPTYATLFQIVQTSDGQLTGFMEYASLHNDGTIQQVNIPLTGARDGKTFSVTLHPDSPGGLFGSSVSLSGTFSGHSITVAGVVSGRTMNIKIGKGSATDYQNDVAALIAKGKSTR